MGINKSLMFIIFAVIFSCFLTSPAASSDTLKQGDVLNSTTFLVSAGNNFTLGFLSLSSLSKDTYLGIWYTDTTFTRRPVWVGNRNTPIIDGNSSVLTINSTGKLIIKNDAGEFIELYAGQTHTNLSATLLDNGNFVVRQLNASGLWDQDILWQSFDYPTDVLLPGMKLGINHKTGRNWSLTSWFADEIPALGAFTLDWEPNAQRLVVKRRGVIYWTSGVLRDKNFEFITTDEFNYNYKFFNVTNEYEEYFTYSLLVGNFTPEDRRIRGQWVLRYDGIMYDSKNGNAIFRIAAVDNCYGYNTRGRGPEMDGGCELWEQPKCRNNHHSFDLRSGHFGPGSEGSFSDYNTSLSLSDCRFNCWNNCDCIGFLSYGTGCKYWNTNAKFQQSLSGAESTQYVLITEAGNKGDKKRVLIITAVVVPLGIIPLVLWCWFRRKIFRLPWVHQTNEERAFIQITTPDDYAKTNELENEGSIGIDLKAFGFQSIMAATNSFSSETKLGEGGFGPVYKGKLPNDREIAVKRLSRSSGQGLVEFKNELILIAKLQHTNLVRLLGYCIRGDEKMLIYEYMPNKSLDYFLFDPTQRERLTWERRFSIIEGIAQGLLYLHRYSRLRIIHRDLKASNILLDENMNPKISDFGMARMFKQNVTEANTNRVVGTYGYMAPEYAMEGIFSVKSDIFSFGVLMLEIVSGRRNNSFYQIDGPLNLVGYAWELWKKDDVLELVDSTLSGSCSTHQLLRCIHVSLLCVEDCAIDRPTISDVVSMLTNDGMDLPVPKRPAFFARSSVVDDDLQKSKSGKHTVNGLTISAMDAR